MAEGGEDKDQKTEQPSQKRLEEAMKRGQVPYSREIGNFLILFVLAITIAWMMPDMCRRTLTLLKPFLASAADMPMDKDSIGHMLQALALSAMTLIIGPLLLACVVAIAAALGQNGVVLSAEPIMPKWNKISPMKGLERMFSMKSLVEFLKGIAKITVVGSVAYYSVSNQFGHIHQLTGSDTVALLMFLLKLSVRLMLGVCVAMFFIALVDLMYQRFAFTKSLRMSRQELKEEYRQSEGDPHVKRRLKQIRMERSRKRMMAAVPGADVVITNPTHFAVALKYETGKMGAPKVVAKAVDNLALVLRKIAKENDVAIVENPPLARALYDAVEVDEEIPITHYQAVAEIISYVWRLKGKLPPEARRSTL